MGRYADSLLTEGEVIVLRTRQHWLALIGRARAGVVLFLGGLVLLFLIAYFNVAPGALRDILSGIALIMLALGAIVFLYRLWIWWAQDFIITNRRLLKVTGVLNKRSGDSSLEKINDAVLIQSLFGRMFNYGDLEILTAAEMAVDRYHMLNDPKTFKKTMLTQKHNLETEFVSGRAPTPPLRADAQPAAPVATAPAAAPQAPSPEATPDESLEVTQTLARLADLRDSGAITAEEYEAKKDELLGRL